jgi:ribosomal protein S18 acetylase RimI-like enzyme
MRSILSSGYLKQEKPGAQTRTRKFFITRLNEKHLPKIMALQQVIVEHLGKSDLFHSFTYDFMKQHVERKGIVLGVFVNDRLAAFRNLYYPDPWDKRWNLGIDIGLAEAQLNHVVNLQMVCVHPHFRGNALASKMNTIALELLREKGTHHHVCATVSPKNIWNIPVLLGSGFHIARLKKKYGGKIRYVVYQNLRETQSFDDSTSIRVPLQDLYTQKRLFGAGFRGTTLLQRKRSGRKRSIDCLDLVFTYPVNKKPGFIDWDTPHELCDFPEKATNRGVIGMKSFSCPTITA